ncbi:sulfotransferase [Rhodanobacter sp. T12-5]|nr:sulfotransferase [Rhodanobacter sp. T12-5]
MRPVHFISGLPRSGSTLLAGLLRQNPRFHAGMSSPVGGLFDTLQGQMSGRNEYAVFINDTQRQRILRGLFDNYYGDEFSADVVFDAHRIWCSKLGILKVLFPQAKMIACVRDMPWIIDSIERLVRSNTLPLSSIFNYQPGSTVYSGSESLAHDDGIVGFAYNALKEAYYGEDTANLMLLQYETLVSNPVAAVRAVYAFIGEPVFSHDLENVSLDADEVDRRAGTPGLSAVRKKVEARERISVLPPDVFRRFENDAFWRDPQLNPRGVRVV